ncbi:MAG: hypothetical protein WA584_19205 [Pyrinomonadaceae bacterium]
MSDEERFKRIERAIITMQDLVISHDERLEDYFRALRESREDFNFKLNALIDAQIKNEQEIQELKEASKSHLQRIENIENK